MNKPKKDASLHQIDIRSTHEEVQLKHINERDGLTVDFNPLKTSLNIFTTNNCLSLTILNLISLGLRLSGFVKKEKLH